jgi:hypothetical protein
LIIQIDNVQLEQVVEPSPIGRLDNPMEKVIDFSLGPAAYHRGGCPHLDLMFMRVRQSLGFLDPVNAARAATRRYRNRHLICPANGPAPASKMTKYRE